MPACIATNLSIDLNQIAATQITELEFNEINARDGRFHKVAIRSNALGMRCDLKMDRGMLQRHLEPFVDARYAEWPLLSTQWFSGLVDGGAQVAAALPLPCDHWIDEPLYMVTRRGHVNTYHAFEDFVASFVLFSATRWDTAKGRVITADIWPAGPYSVLWESLFSRRPVASLASFKQDLIDQGIGRVCVRKVLFSPPAHALIWVFGMSGERANTACVSKILQAFVWQSLMALQLTFSEPTVRIVVTFVDRPKGSKAGGGRHMDNVAEALTSVQRLLANRAPMVEFGIFDFGGLTFVQQVARAMRTDVLIGPHGAGLTHMLWLQEHSLVIEIQKEGQRRGDYYFHMAVVTNKSFLRLEVGNTDVLDTKSVALMAVEIARLHDSRMRAQLHD
jgi:hypothetical protein